MRLSIRVRGELVRQGLENLQAEIPAVGRRRIRTIANRIVRRMQYYPSERPGQTYQRTGGMMKWRIEELTNRGYQLRVIPDYAPFVIGDAYGTSQAWMHKGRWPVFRDVSEEELQALPKEILDEIVMVARRQEFKVT